MERTAKLLINLLENYYNAVKESGEINEMWFLDFLDALNEISVRN